MKQQDNMTQIKKVNILTLAKKNGKKKDKNRGEGVARGKKKKKKPTHLAVGEAMQQMKQKKRERQQNKQNHGTTGHNPNIKTIK